MTEPNLGAQDQCGLSASLPGGMLQSRAWALQLCSKMSRFWASLKSLCKTRSAEGGKLSILWRLKAL